MERAVKTIIQKCMNIQNNEELLIITDEKTQKIGMVFFDTAKAIGIETSLVMMAQRELHGAEPPQAIANAMLRADVIIAPTTKSLSHTKARAAATKIGARIASMPTITEEILTRSMSADYLLIKKKTDRFCRKLSKGKEAILTTPMGTSVTFSIEGREPLADTGVLYNRGDFGNLPAGEAFIVPKEGRTNGTVYIDGSIAGIGLIKEPIKMVIANGYVTEITGGEQAEILNDLLRNKGKEAKNIAELGIGTNDKTVMSGSPLEDEKVIGTVHVAIGDSSTIGGKVTAPLHLDGIIKNPTLVIDGEVIIKNGEHLI